MKHDEVRPPRLRRLALAALVSLPFLASCTIPLEENDWSAYDGPGQPYFVEEEMEFPLDLMRDPLEPINRPISAFNYAILYGIVQPIAWVYRTITPEYFRERVNNVFDNALYPVRLVNNLLQGKWGGAGRETQRFLINTTVGVAGIWDPAEAKWDIKESREDLGQTFHRWGWNNSWYLVVPILGPSTVRDGIGQMGDYFLDPLTYWRPEGSYLQYYRVFNKLSDFVPGIVDFVQRNYDPYQLSKLLFILNREIQVDDLSYASEDTGDTETLESIFFKPEDEDWDDKCESRTIDLPNGRKVAYSAWIQDDPGPLLFFIPGTGGHRLDNSALAVSEIAYGNGRSVLTISSALHTEFIQNTLTSAVPGFMPADSMDTHIAFDAIQKDLVERYGPDHFTELWMGGLSLGAMTSFYVAAQNSDPADTLVDFDTYIAINCPIDLEHAVRTLDSFFNTPLQFSPDERPEKVRALLRKTLDLGTSGDLQPGNPVPFLEWEARFLIGFAFRLTVIATIQQTQTNDDLGVLKTKRTWYRKSMSYLECSTFSFIEYMYAFVLPYFAGVRDDITFDEAGARRLLSMCNIQSLENRIRGQEILYFSNRNDPLLRPEDISWVERTLGDNALMFDEGGHMGNLSQKNVQEAIQAAVRMHVEPEPQPKP